IIRVTGGTWLRLRGRESLQNLLVIDGVDVHLARNAAPGRHAGHAISRFQELEEAIEKMRIAWSGNQVFIKPGSALLRSSWSCRRARGKLLREFMWPETRDLQQLHRANQ